MSLPSHLGLVSFLVYSSAWICLNAVLNFLLAVNTGRILKKNKIKGHAGSSPVLSAPG